jgi:hypothetical protein
MTALARVPPRVAARFGALTGHGTGLAGIAIAAAMDALPMRLSAREMAAATGV